MAFKKLSEYTNQERFNGKASARLHLAYRKSMEVPFFNMLTFCTPKDVDSTASNGSEHVIISYIKGLTPSQRRKVGLEGQPLNVVRDTVTFIMDCINNTYQVDRRQYRSASEFTAVVADNANDATLSITDEFISKFFKAKKVENEWNWDGLDRFFEQGGALAHMDIKTPLELKGGVTTHAAALKFGELMRRAINGMGSKSKPTCICTTAEGLNLIQAYNQITNVGIKYIKIGDVDYTDFMGIPVCDLSDEVYDETLLAEGTPFYFLRMVKDKTGLVVLTPDGKIFDPIAPDMNSGDGHRVKSGSNEMVCCPVPLTYECAARVRVKVTPEEQAED